MQIKCVQDLRLLIESLRDDMPVECFSGGMCSFVDFSIDVTDRHPDTGEHIEKSLVVRSE